MARNKLFTGWYLEGCGSNAKTASDGIIPPRPHHGEHAADVSDTREFPLRFLSRTGHGYNAACIERTWADSPTQLPRCDLEKIGRRLPINTGMFQGRLASGGVTGHLHEFLDSRIAFIEACDWARVAISAGWRLRGIAGVTGGAIEQRVRQDFAHALNQENRNKPGRR
jgi:hypothetical protein